MSWWIRVKEYASDLAMARGDKPVKEYDAIDEHTGRRREWVGRHEAYQCAQSWAAVELRPITYEVQ